MARGGGRPIVIKTMAFFGGDGRRREEQLASNQSDLHYIWGKL